MLFEDRRRRSSFIDFSGIQVFLAIFSSALIFLCFVSLCQDKEMKARPAGQKLTSTLRSPQPVSVEKPQSQFAAPQGGISLRSSCS